MSQIEAYHLITNYNLVLYEPQEGTSKLPSLTKLESVLHSFYGKLPHAV